MVHDPVHLLDVEKVLLSVSPTKGGPDGAPDTEAVVTWESSDPAQISLEPVGNGLTCWALTPLESGSATITANATSHGVVYEPESVLIDYAPAQPGMLNLSVGTPVSDLPE